MSEPFDASLVGRVEKSLPFVEATEALMKDIRDSVSANSEICPYVGCGYVNMMIGTVRPDGTEFSATFGPGQYFNEICISAPLRCSYISQAHVGSQINLGVRD